MEKFEPQQLRDKLAKEIQEAPKEARKEILEQAEETSEYWQARGEKIKERQNEEEIDNGLGILLKQKMLYHGSGVSGIKTFNKAEDDTVGNGIYLTSDAMDAIKYAKIRSKRERDPNKADGSPAVKDSVPVIYESSVENLKLCDLRKDENVRNILSGFRKILLENAKKPDLIWFVKNSYLRTIETIDAGYTRAGNLRNVAHSNGQLFSDYIKSLGYEGLVTLEGGEEGNGDHDTYLIFDSKDVKINKESKVMNADSGSNLES